MLTNENAAENIVNSELFAAKTENFAEINQFEEDKEN